MSARNLRRSDDPNRVVPKLDPQLGFVLHVRPERVRARVLTTDGAGKAAGALRLVDSTLGGLVSVVAVSRLGRVIGVLGKAGADGSQHFELDLPVAVRGAARWEFRAVDVNRREHRVSWPIEAEHGLQVGGGVGDACWQRSITGYCDLMTDWAVAEAEDVTVTDEELSIELRLIGLEYPTVRARGCRAGSPTYPCGAWNRRATGYDWCFRASCPLGPARASSPER